jgi:NAD(P)-dependent dehydrogenase (short-subunit alcohol dehydrogenase family)
MTRRLQDKVVLVTGGSSGIGRASAVRFGKEGARVVIGDVNVEGGEETVKMIKQAGGEAIFVKANVSVAAEVEALVNKTVKTYGRLDRAFNNVGLGDLTTVAQSTEADWDRVLDINLKGMWLSMKYEIPELIKNGGGAIVNNASAWGLRGGVAGMASYVTSKHGVVGLSKAAALENVKNNISVNTICPLAIATRPTIKQYGDEPPKEASNLFTPEVMATITPPMGREGTPDEVAEVVLWFFAEAPKFVTGVALPIDGGWCAR